jgi:hypothetical protein
MSDMANEKPIIDGMLSHKGAGAPLFAKVSGPPSPTGQMWRRKVTGKWEYQQKLETQEHFDCHAC